MKGAFSLSEAQIDVNVSSQPGAYILVNNSNSAVYVGRADSDLKTRLKDHLPGNETNPCVQRSGVVNFYFENTASSKDAYILECDWYHRYRPTCNIAHPAKISFNLTCPVCKV
jgi:excinuclease UvrABC nuclease subunit